MQLTITDSDLLNPALAESLVVFIQHAANLAKLEGGDLTQYEKASLYGVAAGTGHAPPPIEKPEQAKGQIVHAELVTSVAPPPPAFTPEEVDEHAGPQVAPVNGLDSAGLPWDEKIHSATKATNADGTWRRRRGVDDAVYNARVAELRAQADAGAGAPAAADTPFNPNDGFDAFARSGVVAPPPPPVPVVQQPAAVVPPAPPAPAPIADPYVALIQKITRECITADRYGKALAIGGLANLAAGMANPAGALAALEALNDGRA